MCVCVDFFFVCEFLELILYFIYFHWKHVLVIDVHGKGVYIYFCGFAYASVGEFVKTDTYSFVTNTRN